MAPSGVQKERLRPEDIFLLSARGHRRARLRGGARAATWRLKVSECRPLFFNAYRLRDAGAVMHSHSVWAVLAARLFAPQGGPGEFVCQGLEMQKGLRGFGCFDTLRVPIIANTPRESQPTASMAEGLRVHEGHFIRDCAEMAARASLFRKESRWGLYHYRHRILPEMDDERWFEHVNLKRNERREMEAPT